MQKTILITGSTDGIGLEAARLLTARGHRVLLHGRSTAKLQAAQEALNTEGLACDLSRLPDVAVFADTVAERFPELDVLVNNAGVFGARDNTGSLDLRFVVNTLAPWILTRRLMPVLGRGGRVVNVASAAQQPVDLRALSGERQISQDFAAYAQSKLALISWSGHLARAAGPDAPAVISLNPGSMLGTKMVKSAFGVPGRSVNIGAEIIARASTGDDFAGASGRYFDNDEGRFAPPHPAASDPQRSAALVAAIEALVA